MKTEFLKVPRQFKIQQITLRDCGKIFLDPDEMVSLVTERGGECDITSKEWGFYLGPSLNRRLKNQGFKVALALNNQDKIFIMAVEIHRMIDFKKYLRENPDIRVLSWLDEWFQEKA